MDTFRLACEGGGLHRWPQGGRTEARPHIQPRYLQLRKPTVLRRSVDGWWPTTIALRVRETGRF